MNLRPYVAACWISMERERTSQPSREWKHHAVRDPAEIELLNGGRSPFVSVTRMLVLAIPAIVDYDDSFWIMSGHLGEQDVPGC